MKRIKVLIILFFLTISHSVSALIITEVQIAGDQTDNDYVKIYNEQEVDSHADGWRLRKKSSTGQEYSLRVFPKDTIIPSGHYLIWANSKNGFPEQIGASLSSTGTLSSDNSIALIDSNGIIVSSVAWGQGREQFQEGLKHLPNPEPNQQIIRRETEGVYQMTQSNIDDFHLTEVTFASTELDFIPSVPLRRRAQSMTGLILAAIIVSLCVGKLFTLYYQDNYKIS